MNFESYDPTSDPPIRLDSWLDLHVQNYESDFKQFWGIDADRCPEHLTFEDWRDACLIAPAFDSLLGSLKELALNPRALKYAEERSAPGNPLESLPDVTVNAYVQDRIQIEMAYDALVRWNQASKRATFLTLLLGKARLGEVAQGYVRRTTDLFLWGFDLEAMIMASCVLEAALGRELEDVALEQYGLRRNPGQVDWRYEQLIDGAAMAGVFSDKQREDAHALRVLRNRLLHDIPTADERVEHVLWKLYELLAALCPGRGYLLEG